MTAALLARYENGGFEVSIHADGTKIRRQTRADAVPLMPEQMDLKITDWCDNDCAWCHEGSTVSGRHGDIDAILECLSPLPAGVEVAIGGGDPLSHPRFDDLVRVLQSRGIICSVTVNGRHFARHEERLKRLTGKGHLYGVGVSYSGTMPAWDYPHLVVHLIAGIHKPEVLDGIERKKLLILGYKQHGRGRALYALIPDDIQKNLKQWYRELFWIVQAHDLSFDNLAIEQLRPERLLRDPALYQCRYMGHEGAFSMYIDGVTQTFGLSSYSTRREPWRDIANMFASVREQGASLG